ncbi:RraA family protein [Desertimonas flava]|uniref:RraA family protein n=1 Tax=Desertimonas flava TaxID=2064846 RepID=UPI000E34DD2B|nr:RraA family protein [Desertimonas flava]
MSDEIRRRLERLDSCAVADAGDALGITTWVPGLAPRSGQPRMVGRCVTVQLGAPTEVGASRHLGTGAVEASGPGDVIVVAHQARTDCAGWGGNLSRAAKQLGLEGTIVHGAVRDVDEAEAIGYSVFASAVTPVTARGRAHEHAWGQAVELGGVVVANGDWVLADRSGVVFLAADRVDELLGRAEVIAEREAAMAAEIDAGAPVSSVMGASYETMLEKTS